MRRIFLILLPVFLQITAYAQRRQQTANLYTFARLYGYVRYFHPSDANVVTDWDNFAIYGARQVEKAGSREELQRILEQLFKPIAPSLQIYPSGTHPAFNMQQITPADTSNMKVVAWQHNGYGPGSNSQTYTSLRTNSYIKKTAPFQMSHFSSIMHNLDGKPYQGHMVRYSAAIKPIDLDKGTAQLWLRVDREGNQPGFFDNMDDRPVTGVNKDWRRDTITGTIDADARNIAFGCFITKKGRMLIDDIKLEIQTAEGWQTIKELNGDFETDSLGTFPGYWHFNRADQLFTVKTSDLNAINGKQALFLERNTAPAGYAGTTTLFSPALPAGSLIKKDIGSGLSITLPVALWGDGQRTYPLTDTAQIALLNSTIAGALPSPLSGTDLYVRLADVIITWNVFQHFHPYFKEWVTDWDKDLQWGLNACYEDSTVQGFGTTLKKLTAKMRDGHIYVGTPSAKPMAFLPLKWEWVENQLVLTEVLSPDVPFKPGDIITAINGAPAKDYIDKTAATISAGTPEAITSNALMMMSIGAKDTSLHLSVLGADKKEQALDVPFSLNGNDYAQRDLQKKAWEQVDTGIFYINLSLLPWNELKAKLPELSAAKAVIFDLRGYPKDMNGSYLLPHLLKQPEQVKWMRQQQISLPDHENTGWYEVGWGLQPAAPHIGGKVFFLTNVHAISYAESVMGYVKGQRLGAIIGETTAGANGDVNRVTLPGGYNFSFTGLKVVRHDGAQHFMKGIQPDVVVPKTIKGIRENRDEVMAKAIELSR